MELNYDDVYEFLTFHRYPTGFSKNQKRVLRRKSQDHFRVKRGLLFYSTKRRADGERRQWRQVPRTVAEQERIIRACHSSVEGKQAKLSDLILLALHVVRLSLLSNIFCSVAMEVATSDTRYVLNECCICFLLGGHLGRDKTCQKIAARFYWKSLWTDVKQYVHHCETCQRTNDVKFQKTTAPLHPIPVKSKVWNQVRLCQKYYSCRVELC